ncbi:egg cell-secreted protein 1.2-like [Pyrus x bretschneideri]|uniref:egg cell-secreted protein 1.2-like n=1 Tax=Pyrus x bretschneideri TaxID=225117 RepID=UPI0020304AEF|nr:egg cell-secreted protein 1.2-like [Pyrus x bretschneideri]
MASLNVAFPVAVCLIFLAADHALAARNVINPMQPGYNIPITARIKTGNEGDGGLADCWNALVELKSCSNEVVLFFLNGQADIGPDCCKAIATITHHCWPAMLTSIGFTAEEGTILRRYCDAAASATSTNSSAPASPPLAATATTPVPPAH